MRYLVIISIVFYSTSLLGQKTFDSINSLWDYAETSSINLQSNNIKNEQAIQGKLAAILSIPDINGNVNGSFVNNTKLPVSILDASAFGGAPGTTRELTVGSKYQTSFNQNIDIKLVNLEGIQNLSLAKLNIQISKTDALLNKKTMFENIAISYYNILQLQEQFKFTEYNINVADTLYQIVNKKFTEGLVKQQDVNDAKVSLLSIQETKKQIEYSINQQYIALKILCDIPDNVEIKINQPIETVAIDGLMNATQNSLLIQNYAFKEKYAYSSLKKANNSFLPTLSFIGSNSYNVYNQDFMVFDGSWINNNYVGLKINWAIPNANMITNKTNAKFNYILATKAKDQATIKSNNEVLQLNNDLLKAISQNKNQKEIVELQEDTYIKNKNLYVEGIQSLDRLLTSFNNKVNAEYNLISSRVAIELAQKKINLNNKFSYNEK